jgi:hypothetical protein
MHRLDSWIHHDSLTTACGIRQGQTSQESFLHRGAIRFFCGSNCATTSLDSPACLAECAVMATRKATRPAKSPTKGALLAAKYRARANTLTDEERQRHRAHAMSVIYGNPDGHAVHARSR